MAKQAKIDGDISLDDIKEACQVEQGASYQLTTIEGKVEADGNQTLRYNLTNFKRKPSAKILKKLTFVDIKGKSTTEIDKIKADMAGEGQTLLCDVSEIIVSKNATKVLVFGKN